MSTVESNTNSIQMLFRISDDSGNESAIENKAIVLAHYIEDLFGVDGSNITMNTGRWKGRIEFGATIEVCAKSFGTEVDDWMKRIGKYAEERFGFTVFVTVNQVKVYELY